MMDSTSTKKCTLTDKQLADEVRRTCQDMADAGIPGLIFAIHPENKAIVTDVSLLEELMETPFDFLTVIMASLKLIDEIELKALRAVAKSIAVKKLIQVQQEEADAARL